MCHQLWRLSDVLFFILFYMEQSWARTTIGLIISGGEKRKESDVYRIVCVCGTEEEEEEGKKSLALP